MSDTIYSVDERSGGKEISVGVKSDADKAPLHMIDPEFEIAMAQVLAYGAKKYAENNWKKGMDWGRVYSAARRHLNAFWCGEDVDKETNISHIAHAAVNIMFLYHYSIHKKQYDNRPLPEEQK